MVLHIVLRFAVYCIICNYICHCGLLESESIDLHLDHEENNEFWKNISYLINTFNKEYNLLLFDNTVQECRSKLLSLFDECMFVNSYDIYGYEYNKITLKLNDILMEQTSDQQVITVVGSESFIKRTFYIAETIDEKIGRHGHFLFLYKWIIIPNTNCDAFVTSIDPFYHVLCVEINYQNQSKDIICRNGIQIRAIKTGIFCDQRRTFVEVSTKDTAKYNNQRLFPNTAYRLNGRHFLIGSQLWPPLYFNMHFNNTDNVTTYSGIYLDVIQIFAQYLNMSYGIVVPKGGAWGGVDENGTWKGLVGQLSRREVDFVIAPLTVSSIRKSVMDYADQNLEVAYVGGFYRKPEYTIDTLAILTRPFRLMVWIAVLLGLVGYTFILLITQNLICYIETNDCWLLRERRDIFHFTCSIIKSFVQASCTLVQQPIQLNLIKVGSIRIIWSCWFMYAVLVISLWSANIISHLTVPKYKAPFSTLDELVAQDTYKYGTAESGFTASYLASSSTSPRKDIWTNIQRFAESDSDILNINFPPMLKKVQEENFVYFTDSPGIHYAMSVDCNLDELTEQLCNAPYAVGLQQNSAYKSLINEASLWIVETGIMAKILEKWQPKRTCDSNEQGPTPLSLTHMSGVFYSMTLCLMFSICVLFIEYFTFKIGRIIKFHKKLNN